MSYDITLFLLALCVATLTAIIVGTITGILNSIDGATLPKAIIRGGVAFGSTLTLAVNIRSSRGAVGRLRSSATECESRSHRFTEYLPLAILALTLIAQLFHR